MLVLSQVHWSFEKNSPSLILPSFCVFLLIRLAVSKIFSHWKDWGKTLEILIINFTFFRIIYDCLYYLILVGWCTYVVPWTCSWPINPKKWNRQLDRNFAVFHWDWNMFVYSMRDGLCVLRGRIVMVIVVFHWIFSESITMGKLSKVSNKSLLEGWKY